MCRGESIQSYVCQLHVFLSQQPLHLSYSLITTTQEIKLLSAH